MVAGGFHLLHCCQCCVIIRHIYATVTAEGTPRRSESETIAAVHGNRACLCPVFWTRSFLLKRICPHQPLQTPLRCTTLRAALLVFSSSFWPDTTSSRSGVSSAEHWRITAPVSLGLQQAWLAGAVNTLISRVITTVQETVLWGCAKRTPKSFTTTCAKRVEVNLVRPPKAACFSAEEEECDSAWSNAPTRS